MSAEIRPDFLNLRVWATNLAAILGTGAHELSDNFGNVISSRSPAEAAEETPVLLRGKAVAKLKAAAGQSLPLRQTVEVALEAELRALNAENALEANQLLGRDLDAILDLSESDTTSLEDVLRHALRLLRAHVWVERCSVFGMLDGFTLEGLVALGWENEAWKSLYSSVAGVAAATRKPYAVEDPPKDLHLRGRPGSENVRNVICFPLVHGNTVVGALILSNRVGAAFSEEETDHSRRFAALLAHLIQKHMFKERMHAFERTSENLGKYLSQKVVKSVESTQELLLGGAEKKVVCLFSDLRGYTSITEGISPATLVTLLNFHFERMHAIIEKNEGTLDKIVGDLIMAVWNIPKDQPEPELMAMKAALEMQKEMIRTVIPEWQRQGVEKVGMGIGVNAGAALAGNLGSSRFMNYTVVGDAVNTAQRLESKARAGEIWMNESMYPAVQGKLEKPVRKEVDIRLKGKEQTICALVYKPLQY